MISKTTKINKVRVNDKGYFGNDLSQIRRAIVQGNLLNVTKITDKFYHNNISYRLFVNEKEV